MSKFIFIFIFIFSLTLTGHSPKLVKPEKIDQLEALQKENLKKLNELEKQIDKYDNP